MSKIIARNVTGWYALRWKVLERDKFTCQYCGRSAPSVPLEVDHRIPKSEGGTDHQDNLVCSCWSCNRGKSAYFRMNKQERDTPTSITGQIPMALSDGAKTVEELSILLNQKAGNIRSMLKRLALLGRVVRVGGDGKGGKHRKSYWVRNE